MPIYDIQCRSCGFAGEVLLTASADSQACPDCGSTDTQRLMAPTSGLTGRAPRTHPGPGDTACCGTRPSNAGCAGPGSCCGRPHG